MSSPCKRKKMLGLQLGSVVMVLTVVAGAGTMVMAARLFYETF